MEKIINIIRKISKLIVLAYMLNTCIVYNMNNATTFSNIFSIIVMMAWVLSIDTFIDNR